MGEHNVILLLCLSLFFMISIKKKVCYIGQKLLEVVSENKLFHRSRLKFAPQQF